MSITSLYCNDIYSSYKRLPVSLLNNSTQDLMVDLIEDRLEDRDFGRQALAFCHRRILNELNDNEQLNKYLSNLIVTGKKLPGWPDDRKTIFTYQNDIRQKLGMPVEEIEETYDWPCSIL